jgi:hypothetical protein
MKRTDVLLVALLFMLIGCSIGAAYAKTNHRSIGVGHVGK